MALENDVATRRRRVLLLLGMYLICAARCESQGRGSPLGTDGGFWPDDFSKKNFPWVPYFD